LRDLQIDLIYDRTYRATLDAAGATWLRPTPRLSCCVVDPGPELKQHAGWCSFPIWLLARWAYRRASLVLANSDSLRLRVIRYFRLKPDHVVVQYNLVDFVDLDSRAAPLDDVTVDNRFLIVAAGRLHPQKGYLHLLNAMHELVVKRHWPMRLVVLGTGPQLATLLQHVESLQLQQAVEFRGFVENPLPWIKRAKLFVLSSLYEGLPNALLEAVACGTPAVATDCPSGPADILDEGRWGALVPPSDPLALAEAIQSAFLNYSDWQVRAAVARQTIRLRYDASRQMSQFQDLLLQTAAK